MKPDNLIRNISVRTHLKINGEMRNHGSGIIIKDLDSFFVLTAYHCVYGINNEYQNESINNLYLEYKKGNFQTEFIRLTSLEIVAKNRKQDWILIRIEDPYLEVDFSKIKFGIASETEIDANFCGYQKVDPETPRPWKANLLLTSPKQFRITLIDESFNQGGELGSDVAKGLSGSGVCIIIGDIVYLIGILVSVIGEEAYNSDVECCAISCLEDNLKSKLELVPKNSYLDRSLANLKGFIYGLLEKCIFGIKRFLITNYKIILAIIFTCFCFYTTNHLYQYYTNPFKEIDNKINALETNNTLEELQSIKNDLFVTIFNSNSNEIVASSLIRLILIYKQLNLLPATDLKELYKLALITNESKSFKFLHRIKSKIKDFQTEVDYTKFNYDVVSVSGGTISFIPNPHRIKLLANITIDKNYPVLLPDFEDTSIFLYSLEKATRTSAIIYEDGFSNIRIKSSFPELKSNFEMEVPSLVILSQSDSLPQAYDQNIFNYQESCRQLKEAYQDIIKLNFSNATQTLLSIIGQDSLHKLEPIITLLGWISSSSISDQESFNQFSQLLSNFPLGFYGNYTNILLKIVSSHSPNLHASTSYTLLCNIKNEINAIDKLNFREKEMLQSLLDFAIILKNNFDQSIFNFIGSFDTSSNDCNCMDKLWKLKSTADELGNPLLSRMVLSQIILFSKSKREKINYFQKLLQIKNEEPHDFDLFVLDKLLFQLTNRKDFVLTKKESTLLLNEIKQAFRIGKTIALNENVSLRTILTLIKLNSILDEKNREELNSLIEAIFTVNLKNEFQGILSNLLFQYMTNPEGVINYLKLFEPLIECSLSIKVSKFDDKTKIRNVLLANIIGAGKKILDGNLEKAERHFVKAIKYYSFMSDSTKESAEPIGPLLNLLGFVLYTELGETERANIFKSEFSKEFTASLQSGAFGNLNSEKPYLVQYDWVPIIDLCLDFYSSFKDDNLKPFQFRVGLLETLEKHNQKNLLDLSNPIDFIINSLLKIAQINLADEIGYKEQYHKEIEDLQEYMNKYNFLFNANDPDYIVILAKLLQTVIQHTFQNNEIISFEEFSWIGKIITDVFEEFDLNAEQLISEYKTSVIKDPNSTARFISILKWQICEIAKNAIDFKEIDVFLVQFKKIIDQQIKWTKDDKEIAAFLRIENLFIATMTSTPSSAVVEDFVNHETDEFNSAVYAICLNDFLNNDFVLEKIKQYNFSNTKTQRKIGLLDFHKARLYSNMAGYQNKAYDILDSLLKFENQYRSDIVLNSNNFTGILYDSIVLDITADFSIESLINQKGAVSVGASIGYSPSEGYRNFGFYSNFSFQIGPPKIALDAALLKLYLSLFLSDSKKVRTSYVFLIKMLTEGSYNTFGDCYYACREIDNPKLGYLNQIASNLCWLVSLLDLKDYSNESKELFEITKKFFNPSDADFDSREFWDLYIEDYEPPILFSEVQHASKLSKILSEVFSSIITEGKTIPVFNEKIDSLSVISSIDTINYVTRKRIERYNFHPNKKDLDYFKRVYRHDLEIEINLLLQLEEILNNDSHKERLLIQLESDFNNILKLDNNYIQKNTEYILDNIALTEVPTKSSLDLLSKMLFDSYLEKGYDYFKQVCSSMFSNLTEGGIRIEQHSVPLLETIVAIHQTEDDIRQISLAFQNIDSFQFEEIRFLHELSKKKSTIRRPDDSLFFNSKFSEIIEIEEYNMTAPQVLLNDYFYYLKGVKNFQSKFFEEKEFEWQIEEIETIMNSISLTSIRQNLFAIAYEHFGLIPDYNQFYLDYFEVRNSKKGKYNIQESLAYTFLVDQSLNENNCQLPNNFMELKHLLHPIFLDVVNYKKEICSVKCIAELHASFDKTIELYKKLQASEFPSAEELAPYYSDALELLSFLIVQVPDPKRRDKIQSLIDEENILPFKMALLEIQIINEMAEENINNSIGLVQQMLDLLGYDEISVRIKMEMLSRQLNYFNLNEKKLISVIEDEINNALIASDEDYIYFLNTLEIYLYTKLQDYTEASRINSIVKDKIIENQDWNFATIPLLNEILINSTIGEYTNDNLRDLFKFIRALSISDIPQDNLKNYNHLWQNLFTSLSGSYLRNSDKIELLDSLKHYESRMDLEKENSIIIMSGMKTILQNQVTN